MTERTIVLRFERPMNPDSVRAHLITAAQVGKITPTQIYLNFGPVKDREAVVVLQAGALDQDGRRLSSCSGGRRIVLTRTT